MVSEMIYQSYKWNREQTPSITPERWVPVFPDAMRMEMRLREELLASEAKRLLDATDETLQEWLGEQQQHIPELLADEFNLYCRSCKHFTAKQYDGCDEVGCFKSLDLTVLRSQLEMVSNEWYG